LELGRYLVRELGFEDGVDTLGRWMSHHLAELIDKADNGSTENEQSKALRLAIDTILKIWDHRMSLPGRAYPLNSFKDIILVLDNLRSNSNPFVYFSGSDTDKFASDLFNDLSRLIVMLLLMKIPSRDWQICLDNHVVDNLSENERLIITMLQQWMNFIKPVSTIKIQYQENQQDEIIDKNIDELAINLIDEVMETLGKLREEIKVIKTDS
jgi:hypothetical protein